MLTRFTLVLFALLSGLLSLLTANTSGDQVEITLDTDWMFGGVTYLKGIHKVSPELARIFASRGAFPEQRPAGQPAELVPPQSDQPPTPPSGSPNQLDPDPLATLVGAKAAEVLRAAGYGTPDAWNSADDATLLALDHVGDATLKKLRDFKG